MSSSGWAPMLDRVTGEIVTAESLSRYAQNASWLASSKAFGAVPFPTQRLGGFATAYYWIRHRANTFHYRINVVSLGTGGTWALKYNGTTIKAAAVTTGVRITDGIVETPIDLAALGLTDGTIYLVEVVIAPGTGTPDVRIEWIYETGAIGAYTSFPALPTVTDATVLTAAEMQKYKQALEYLKDVLTAARTGALGVIHTAEAYNDWLPSDSDEWRAGYHFANHGETETTFWEGYLQHVSNTMIYALESYPKTNTQFGVGIVRLYGNGTLLRTLRSSRVARTTCTLSAGVDASVTTIPTTATAFLVAGDWVMIDSEMLYVTAIAGDNLSFTAVRGVNSTTAAAHSSGAAVIRPAAPLTIRESLSLASLSLTEGSFYRFHATYQMTESIGEDDWDNPTLNPPGPDRLDASAWYALEINGDPPGSFTPPNLWAGGNDYRGSASGAGPDLTELNTALTDLNNRIPGHPNYAVQQLTGPWYFQRRRRYLHYRGTGTLGWGEDVYAAGTEQVTLPQATDGIYDLAEIPVGDLYVLLADDFQYLFEDELS